jgi:hypothetical protein
LIEETENTLREIRKFRVDEATIYNRHQKEIHEISGVLKNIQSKCDHKITDYCADPAGGSTSCCICNKEISKYEKGSYDG